VAGSGTGGPPLTRMFLEVVDDIPLSATCIIVESKTAYLAVPEKVTEMILLGNY